MLEKTTRPTGRRTEQRRAIGPLVLALVTAVAAVADGQPPDPFFQEQVPDEVVAMLRDAAAGDDAPPRTAADDARARIIRDNFMRLRDHVILGTDAGAVGDFFGYADHLELELFVRLGMTPAEAIEAATTRAARAFGLDETGAVEAGRSADFVVLDADPLDDITSTRQIAAVYLRGVEVDRDALRARWTE
jgi:imidazolonepropionase-like amidohydrolase